MKSLRRIFQFMRPYAWYLFFGFWATVLPVAMELSVPRLLQFVIDDGIRPREMDMILLGAFWMFVAAMIGALSTLGQGYCRAVVSQGLALDIRHALFRHIQALSFANLDQMQTGQLMTRVSSDVDVVRMFSSAGLALLLRVLLMIVGSMIMLLLTDWQLSLIMFVVAGVSGIFIRYLMLKATRLFTMVQQKLGALNTLVQENLAGIQVVKAFVRGRFEIDQFSESNLDYRERNIEVGQLMAIAMPILQVLTNVGTVAVLWFGGASVIGDRLTIGELIAFNNYLMTGMGPLLFLGNLLMMSARAEASAERVMEVLDTKPALKIARNPHKASRRGGLSGGPMRVGFENVSFHYSRHNGGKSDGANGVSGDDVLHGISFGAEPGQQIALLGATGSGKSTLVNLISRFYDVSGGSVRVDGVDARDWDPADLRANIGMVMQESILFSGSVRENIAYGAPSATLADVIAAARAAQAHNFITEMPRGYDSVVEAGGANLSGGQKQRIAIARALLIKPGILIFDDSTSAVDMETEYRIQAALEQLAARATTFIIAQRITSVIRADQILVLDHGRIAARGRHQDLLHSSEIYREIYESQLGEVARANGRE
ncbi:MAG: ABC transporter ATP-binding protein [Chloroflexi bacterium]|nr:ABC transporter ATP-binding protein [Chloroflexota bacterium]